jgi:flagellar hook protein FlgE
MSFNIALSGLNAARNDLDVTGNNIANANTTGFKRSRAEFADVFAQSFGSIADTAIGGGVRTAAVTQQFEQGSIASTGNALDLAVNGEGFFVVSRNGAITYTRDGSFRVDREGFVINSNSQRLQVFPTLPTSTGFNTGALTDLQLNTAVGAPEQTTEVTATFNVAADSEGTANTAAQTDPPAAGEINPANDSTYNFTTSLTVFDSLGTPHTTTLYLARDSTDSEPDGVLDNPGQWFAHLYVGGQFFGAQTLNFDANGQLIPIEELDGGGNPVAGTETFNFVFGNIAADPVADAGTGFDPGNGASEIFALTFDFTNSTQLGTTSGVTNLVQDGFTTGQLVGLDVSDSGIVQARFTNGRTTPLGKIALANFNNTQGLSQEGDNQWAETFASGAAQIGEAGGSGFGLIESGGLESSNVDLTAALVNLITAQRNFDANSQVIRTENEVTQTAINIGR